MTELHETSNDELFRTLESLAESLDSRIVGSECGEPIDPFMWSQDQQEEFSFVALLRKIICKEKLVEGMHFLADTTIEFATSDWLRGSKVGYQHAPPNPEETQLCKELITCFSQSTDQPGAYKLINESQEQFPIIYGRVDGTADWMALAPDFAGHSIFRFEGQEIRLDRHEPSSRCTELLSTLAPLAAQIHAYVDDNLHGGKKGAQEGMGKGGVKICSASNRDTAIEEVLKKINFLKQWRFHSFRTDGIDPDLEPDLTENVHLLEEFFKSNCAETYLYLLGNSATFHVMVFGKSLNGSWLGIITRAHANF